MMNKIWHRSVVLPHICFVLLFCFVLVMFWPSPRPPQPLPTLGPASEDQCAIIFDVPGFGKSSLFAACVNL